MKLIIVGASGFVATELISQALRRPDVTSLVALSRKPVTAPDGEHAAKLKSVVIGDYGEYPDDVKKELAGADACIWYGSLSQLQNLPPAMTYGYTLQLTRLSPQDCRHHTTQSPQISLRGGGPHLSDQHTVRNEGVP